jgi:hypothetical protein
MSWQFMVFTFVAAFPGLMWLFGQIMESRLEKRGFADYDESINDSIGKQNEIFLSQMLAVVALVCIPLGTFGHTTFLFAGVIALVIELLTMIHLGVFKTLFNG